MLAFEIITAATFFKFQTENSLNIFYFVLLAPQAFKAILCHHKSEGNLLIFSLIPQHRARAEGEQNIDHFFISDHFISITYKSTCPALLKPALNCRIE